MVKGLLLGLTILCCHVGLSTDIQLHRQTATGVGPSCNQILTEEVLSEDMATAGVVAVGVAAVEVAAVGGAAVGVGG